MKINGNLPFEKMFSVDSNYVPLFAVTNLSIHDSEALTSWAFVKED